jgi:GNAT superfamily N-acetyltransferase
LSAAEAGKSFQATLEATRRSSGPAFLAIVEKRGGRAVGLCSIRSIEPHDRRTEMGIMLVRDAHGSGYAREALSALLAAAWRTLPIDTVWVQYRRANSGAARLFDALGFSEIDGWRPRGARSRSCVRIVQRPRRMQSIQSQKKGFSVSNVIGFIENVGRNAALRHASRAQLLLAMRDEGKRCSERMCRRSIR